MTFEEKAIEIAKKTREVATDYNHFLMECGGIFYSYISINEESFSWSVGPCTSGMSWPVSLPLHALDISDDDIDQYLETKANKQKEAWEEERKRNHCESCGQSKLNLYDSIRPNWGY